MSVNENRGRPSKITDPDFAKLVAEAYVSGMRQDEMAIEFDVARHTIAAWVRDPRVQAHVTAFTAERIHRITRRVDSEIEQRLSKAREMDTELLLKVRKEFLDRSLKASGMGAQSAETTNELLEAFDQDPDFAEQLMSLLPKGK